MANKYYEGELNLDLEWGGIKDVQDPLSGQQVQTIIKDSINSKVGYVGRVERTGQGFYVLSRDQKTFEEYLKTISEDNPLGDLTMDGINGHFDAPFNYKMDITLLNPENGYKSTLVGSTGNVIKFKAETLDSNNTPQNENITVTYKIKSEAGTETSFTAIYDSNVAINGIEYNLDGKISAGVNTITITVVGMNTGISAMRRITYRLIDIYFTDKFDITKRYQFTTSGTLSINIGYDLKGIGKTKVLWYFDGNEYAVDELANLNPVISNSSRTFYFTETTSGWLTPGIHAIQMQMVCKDSDSGEEFYTPIYYREFIVEHTPTVLSTPYIVRKFTFEHSHGILKMNEIPSFNNVKQYENVDLEYAAYYNGKSECLVNSYIKYGDNELQLVSSENLPLVLEDFSSRKQQSITLSTDGMAEVILRAVYDEKYFETKIQLEIQKSEMNLSTSDQGLVLLLNAKGRSNNTAGRDTWEYKFTDVYGQEQTIETVFSKNEYVQVSVIDTYNNIVIPDDANADNSLEVDVLPIVENENFKYLIYNGHYYIWDREFDWSDTSGWSNDKLKLSKGNSITINYKPFDTDKLTTLKTQGGTYEFEFETTNVYDDNAVICRICGKDNYTPGIVIYASGAELVISREIVTGDNENAGYTKKVSTKYKAEESNRISFVITPDSDENDYRNRILSIYVNGELCGAYAYDKGTNFYNDSKIVFRASEDACVNISNILIYERALSSNEILNNYIYYRNDTKEKIEIYNRNNIMLDTNNDVFDSDKLKSQLPVMMIYQIDESQSLDDIHQEKKNKKLTRFFDVVYIDIQDPTKNFLVKNAYITPQGTSSMNYPVKNLRLYTGKKDDAKNYYSRLFVGDKIFIDGSPNNISWDNINLATEVSKKRQYAFKDGAIPVNCWTLKADFAESSSSHNTGTSRYWNNVLKNAGLTTKAQNKAAQYAEKYPYDIRTAIDGFPIVVFYQALGGSEPRFEGKYNFNNDKSTEDVFGFTGGIDIEEQEVKYFYIGKEKPIIQSEEDEKGNVEYACDFQHGGFTNNPDEDSPLYVSKYLADGSEEWYMLRGKALLDNPRMECWELLNSVNEIALFKTMQGFGVGDSNEKIGIVKENGDFDEAFESRYPDCGDYYHYNSLKRFGEWLVSCRYLTIDNETGASVPFSPSALPLENYHKNDKGKLSICSLTKQKGIFKFDFPGKNFYSEVDYDSISSNIKEEGYQQINLSDDILDTITYYEVTEIPTTKIQGFEYIKCEELYYTWLPSNVLETDELPDTQQTSYDYILVGGKYYVWDNTYNFENYHNTKWVDDTAFNRALKFAIEKYDHIEMNKMAAYYIYLMRFGGVDQTVKNSMLTTEGPSTEDPNSTLPSLWYFINYDNDTILGVKNDGRLVFDPYITRETKDGTGYVYAGRESTLWNNLEADAQFMEKVTEIDNKLANGGPDPLFSLSYNNALREYDTNQSDKWCERIYNKDAERKYIDTYVKGWVQKIDKEGTETHVYEDYLYDVQGSRSAHRKWWLGRRFNVFDSRFCNTNFRNSLIKFRSTNLPAGSSFTIKSGEPIFYAWGHDNSVTEMTPSAIQPNDYYTFTTTSAFNIGSYLELMGAANISTLDLRNCVGALTEIDVTGCYSPSIGTKMKEILIGDNSRQDLINISNTSLKLSGLGNAIKLESIDVTNIQNAVSLDGLENLLNIRKVYAKGTSISNFTFADGAMIEKLELPKTTESLSLTRSSLINYDNIIFEDDSFGKLNNLTFVDCANLMKDFNFVINWINSKNETQRANLNLNLQGIDWKFSKENYQTLFLLETVGTSTMAQRNIRGNIEITARLDISDVLRLKKIFGNECFKEGSKVYIKAPTGLYVSMPEVLIEGSGDITCDLITVGTTLSGTLDVSILVNEIENGEVVQKIVGATNGNITVNEDNLDQGFITINIKESNNVYKEIVVTAVYREQNGNELMQNAVGVIAKRIYPTAVEISTSKDSYNVKTPINLYSVFTPSELNDLTFEKRGKFSCKWEMIDGSEGYRNSLLLTNTSSEIAVIQAENGYDGTVVLKLTVTRNYDNIIVAEDEKSLEFTNPDTIITKLSNEPLYNILVSHGIIKEDSTGFGKLTKTDATLLTMENMIVNGKSIFEGNKELENFIEFQYFNNTYMGQMPTDGVDKVITPNNMFKGCTNLKAIALSDNFKYTAESMFEGCTNLEHIYGKQVSTNEDGEPEYTDLAIEVIGKNFAYGCTNLKTCLLSSTTKYIGSNAFYGCGKLTNFFVSTSPSLEIIYDINSTPFVGCKNIMFEGAEYGKTSEAKYKVKNGACYEIKEDGTLALIHMGKDTLSSDIPLDRNIYACAYSMEYRTEKDVVIPRNVICNGEYIFIHSTGNTVTLNSVIGGNYGNCKGLFQETSYKHYNFANGETTIPVNCFYNIKYTSDIIFEFPESIKSIENAAFWGAENLKLLGFNSEMPPAFNGDVEGAFRGCMLDSIYVLPEYYENYINNIHHLFKPYILPKYAYAEGYVRIIKDGEIILPNAENIIRIDNLIITEVDFDYIRYTTDERISPIVYLNDEKIGTIKGQYTTFYIGDNSMLYSGEGYDFTYGVYDSTVLEEMNKSGWYYSETFGGIRNQAVRWGYSTQMKYILNNLQNTNFDITYGICINGIISTNKQPVIEFFDNGKSVFNDDGTILGFNKVQNIDVLSGILDVVFTKRPPTSTGMDGIVINKIGNPILNEPLPSLLMTLNNNDEMNDFYSITINLNAEQEIPNTTVVTVTDGYAHTYRQFWNGITLIFILPKKYDFIVDVDDFISENGKLFTVGKSVKVMGECHIEVDFKITTKIELKDNVLYYHTPYNDFYILLDKYNGVWSNNNNLISEVQVSEILLSNTNGFVNTKNIINVEPRGNIFEIAYNTNVFGDKIKGYIPSYIEMQIINNSLNEINEFLISNNKAPIDFSNCWTSEMFNEEKAWTNDGIYLNKNTTANYYIFGRRIKA